MQIGLGYKQVEIYWCHLIYLTLIRAAIVLFNKIKAEYATDRML